MKTIKISLLVVATVAGCGSVTGTTAKESQPTIMTVSPDHGPTPGGAMITLTGTNFKHGNPIVVVGGHEATMVTAASDTSATFVLPEGEEGSVVDVTIANDNGFATKSDSFTYNRLPVILSVTPSLAKGSGGTMITVTGRGFQELEAGTATIAIAGGSATNVQVVDDRTITAMTGAVTPGTKPFTPLDLVLTNANGAATLHNFQVTSKGLLAIERCCAQRVFHIDTATGTVSQIGNLPRNSHGCALSPSGQTYIVTRDATGSKAQLNTWDPLSGMVTSVGPLDDAGAVNHNMTAMTFVGTTLYGLNTASVGTNTGRLASINPTNGQVTIIGAASTGVGRNAGIAIKDANTVYVADATNQSLDTIAIATSVLTTGLPITGGTNAQVHGLVSVAGTFYVSEQNNPAIIYTVNIGSGALTRIATIPAATISSMCETPPSF